MAKRLDIAHGISYAGKANTAAGVVPNFDTGLVPATFHGGSTGAAVRVASGYLTHAPSADGIAAGYMSGDAGAPVVAMGARYKIQGRSAAAESICLAMTATKQSVYAAPFTDAGAHVVIARTTWQVDYIAGGSGVTITNIASGPLGFTLAADDTTVHTVQVYRDYDRIHIKVNGTLVTPAAGVASPHIASKSGSGFWFEPFVADGDSDGIVKISDLWVGVDAPKFLI